MTSEPSINARRRSCHKVPREREGAGRGREERAEAPRVEREGAGRGREERASDRESTRRSGDIMYWALWWWWTATDTYLGVFTDRG